MTSPHSAVVALLALAVGCAVAPSADPSVGLDAFLAELRVNPASPAAFAKYCDEVLGRVGRLRTALERAGGPATIDIDFRQYDNLYLALSVGINDASLVSETHPDSAIREAAISCIERAVALDGEVTVSQPIYRRLAAIDAARLDSETRLVLTRVLAEYRRDGVDKDSATRARIVTVKNEITALGSAFSRNIRDDSSTVSFTSIAALAGVPKDRLDAHPPEKDGRIHIRTEYPDVFPILSYATRVDTRRAIARAFGNRAYPQNTPVLQQLLSKRHELARLLGYPTFAHFATADKMVGTPERAQAFIDELADVARPAAERDYRRQLQRLRRIEPHATTVPYWSEDYVRGLLRREAYRVDGLAVRSFFTYNRVRDGILQWTQDQFGVEVRPWKGAPVWHESVEAFEVYEHGTLLGRFFLDMHPRPGKFTHAASFPIRNGLADREIPTVALICNFPAGDHETGLMEHANVETFFHEFGHSLHLIFANRLGWAQQNAFEVEFDFSESPSTLLEEWAWNYETLSRFAVNAAGDTIPRALVDRMNAARTFGEAQATMSNLASAAVSLGYHNRDPSGLDLQGEYRRHTERYSLTPFNPETHRFAAFGHLYEYSAVYYTYQWSQAIAFDLLTRFQEEGIRNPATARAYRQALLTPGGSKPAARMIQDFLGRPMSLEAYRRRLAR